MANELPQPLVISVPIIYYRLLMLAWALWLALALLGWLVGAGKPLVTVAYGVNRQLEQDVNLDCCTY